MKPILGILQKKILDTIPAGISIASSASGTEVIHNARAAEFLRIQPWEHFAFKFGENQSVKLYHNGKELTPAGLPLNRSAWKGETVKGIEIDFIWDDGVRKTAVWNANPLFDENGLIIGAVAIFEEITALKQAEEALQVNNGEAQGIIPLGNKVGGEHLQDVETVETLAPAMVQAMSRITSNRLLQQSEERYRALVTASSDAVYRMNPDWSEMYFLQERNFIPDTCSPNSAWFDEYIPPDDQPHVAEVINEAIRNKSVLELEHRVRRVDGTLGWAFSRAVPILDAAGEISEWFGTAKDVTARREAEEKLAFQAQVLDSVHDAVCAADENFMITYWNEMAEEMFDWTAREAIGQPAIEIFKMNVPGSTREDLIKKVLVDGCFAGEVIMYHKDGREMYVDAHIRVIRGPDGECKGYVSSIRDITTRRRAEEALRQSEERYRTIFETAAEGITYAKTDGTCLHCNQRFADMLGYAKEEIPGKLSVDLSFADEEPQILQIRRTLNKGDVVSGELRFRRKDGSELWTMFNCTPVFSAAGEHIANFAMHTDITERKRVEAELKRTMDHLEESIVERTRELSQERQRLLDVLETLPVNISLSTPDYKILFANRPFRKTFGKPNGRCCYDYFFGFHEPCEFCQSHQVLETGKPHQWRVKTPGGRIVDIYDYPFTDVGGSHLILQMTIDVTERENAARSLRQSEERFSKIFYHSPVLLAIIRMSDNVFIDVNQKFTDTMEYYREEILGKSILDLNIWAGDSCRTESLFNKLKEKSEVNNFEYRFRTKSGKIITVLLSSIMMDLNGEACRIALMKDITNEKRMEAEITRLDRLNLVGEMAAGIGHEVRNPMTTVRGFLQILGGKEKYAQDKQYFTLMIDELDRANSIISEFLSLAKNKPVKLEMKSLNKILNSILPLIQADGLVTDKHIDLKTKEIPDLSLDEKEIRQLVLNLVRNGLQAMDSGKTLTIETFMDKNNVVLAVKDQGSGIPDEIIDKVGDPFFTTKDSGTGLGLSVCCSIAARHKAKINFDTSPAGTTFFVRFKKPD